MNNDLRLVASAPVIEEIKEIVFQTPLGYETGVALFGMPVGSPSDKRRRFVVLAVAGPGPRATHETSRYSSDTAYTSAIYRALKSALPSIGWLGEIHLHPAGMTWLSSGDRQTIRQLLAGTAGGTVRPHEFIAGVMQRKADGLDIHPVFFDRARLGGVPLPIEHVSSSDEVVRKARDLAASDPVPEPLTESSPEPTPLQSSWWRTPFTIFHRSKKL
jgi:hypothetical protein